jgi:hypothetical protein
MGLMKKLKEHHDMNEILHFDSFQWIFEGVHSPEYSMLLGSFLNYKRVQHLSIILL